VEGNTSLDLHGLHLLPKHLTFADYLLLPTITQRYDSIDGEMVMAAASTGKHRESIGNLAIGRV
jgi:hypothetical protein